MPEETVPTPSPAPRKPSASAAEKGVAQWRTVLSSSAMALMLNATFFFSHPQGEIASKMFSDLCWASTFMAAVVGGKSIFQHVSANGGMKNFVGGLMGAKS